MASEVGNGQVAIFPVFKGFRGAVTKEVEGSAKSASTGFSRIFGSVGAKAGKDVGKQFKGGVTQGAAGAGSALAKKLTAEVASASRQVSAARLKEQDATGRLRVAEAALTEARAKNTAGSSRLVAAEERHASAQRALASAEGTTRDASARLTAAQTRLKSSSDSAGLSAEQAEGKFRRFGSGTVRVFGSVSSAAGGVAKIIGTGIGFAAGALAVQGFTRAVGAATGLIRGSISAASDLQQSIGGVDAVFGKSAGKVHAWANSAARDVGLSANSYNELAAVIGTQLKTAGLSLDEAAKKTKSLIGLSADLAATFGGTTADAASALGAALRGEFDPAERFGLALSQNAVNAEAAKLGFDKVNGSLSTHDQRLATLSLIYKQTGAAQGQFAKQTDTLAEQQQILAAQSENLKAKLGTALLPAVTAVVGALSNGMTPALKILQPVLDKVEAGAGRVAERITAFSESLKAGQSPLEGLFKLALPTVDFSAFTSQVTGALGQLRPALGAFFSYLTNIGPAVGSVLSVLGPALAGVFSQLGPALQQTLPLLAQAVTTLLPSLVQVLLAVIPLLPPLAQIIVSLAPIISLAATALSFLITNGLVPLVQSTAGAYQAVSAFTSGMVPFQVALSAAAGKFGPILQAAAQFGLAIGSNLRSVRLFVAGVVVGFVQFAAAVNSGIARGLGFVQRLAAMPGIAASAIGGFVAQVAGGMGRAASAVGSGINRALAFVRRVGEFPGIATSAAGRFVAALSSGFGRAVGAVSSGVGRVLSEVRTLPGRIGGVLGNLGGILVASGRSLIEGFASGIRGAIGAAVSAASEAVGAVRRLFPFSPAKEGPFSGRGYTTYSGRALMAGLASGIDSGAGVAVRSSSTAVRRVAEQFQTSIGATGRTGTLATSRAADRPIYMDGSLFGVIRELANGEATLVLNTQNTALNTRSRQGRLRPTFAR